MGNGVAASRQEQLKSPFASDELTKHLYKGTGKLKRQKKKGFYLYWKIIQVSASNMISTSAAPRDYLRHGIKLNCHENWPTAMPGARRQSDVGFSH